MWEPRRNIPEELDAAYIYKRNTNDKGRNHNEDTRREPNINLNKTRDNENVAINELRGTRYRD